MVCDLIHSEFFLKNEISKSDLLIEHEPSYEVRAIKSTVSKIDQTLERKQFNAFQDHFNQMSSEKTRNSS